MTCKDCVHYEVCDWHRAYEGYLDLFGAERCDYYQPKSRFVELPCEVGQTVWEVSPVIFVNISFKEFCDIKRNKEDIKVLERVATLEDIAKWMTPCQLTGEKPWGKTVFPSREEAEKALAERRKRSK